VKFFRRRQQGLAQQRQPLDPDGNLAGFGFAEHSFGTDEVAQLKPLYEFPLVGQQFVAQPQLNGSAGIPQRDENKFADIAEQHDSSGTAGTLAFLLILVAVFDGLRRFCIGKPPAVRVNAKLLNLL